MKKITVGKDYNNHYLIVFIDPQSELHDNSRMQQIYVDKENFSKVKDILLKYGEWDVDDE